MDLCTLDAAAPEVSTADMLPPLGPSPALERLGDEIAELSAHHGAARGPGHAATDPHDVTIRQR